MIEEKGRKTKREREREREESPLNETQRGNCSALIVTDDYVVNPELADYKSRIREAERTSDRATRS